MDKEFCLENVEGHLSQGTFCRCKEYKNNNWLLRSADVKEFIRITLRIVDTRLSNRSKLEKIKRAAGEKLVK